MFAARISRVTMLLRRFSTKPEELGQLVKVSASNVTFVEKPAITHVAVAGCEIIRNH